MRSGVMRFSHTHTHTRRERQRVRAYRACLEKRACVQGRASPCMRCHGGRGGKQTAKAGRFGEGIEGYAYIQLGGGSSEGKKDGRIGWFLEDGKRGTRQTALGNKIARQKQKHPTSFFNNGLLTSALGSPGRSYLSDMVSGSKNLRSQPGRKKKEGHNNWNSMMTRRLTRLMTGYCQVKERWPLSGTHTRHDMGSDGRVLEWSWSLVGRCLFCGQRYPSRPGMIRKKRSPLTLPGAAFNAMV